MTGIELKKAYDYLYSIGAVHSQKEFAEKIGRTPETISKVFQMWTGLAYSDAQNFYIRRYKLEDGVLTYVGERIKTGVNYVSRLLPPAVAILEKYGMQTPKIGNADYNHLLKGIGIAAGIHTPLHSHMARHSFATYMLNNDVSLDSVSVMLGHTNTVQTRRYAKTLAKTVKDDFDKVAEKLKTAISSQT